MRNAALGALGVVDVLANLPYIIDTYKGKTKPNIAAWSTLTLINAITVFAALAAGDAINTAVLGFSYLLGSVCILVLAFLKGTRGYTKFDAVFQAMAVVGIVIWQLTSDPTIGLITVIIVGELAAIPMYRHAFRYLNEETLSTFVIASLVAFGTLCLAASPTFAALAVPIDLITGNGLMAALIFIRRSSKYGAKHKVQQII